MDNRHAVMDLGTNTFHLLIVEGSVDDLRIIVHEHIAVKIGEGGINKGLITEAAFQRGLNTMKDFSERIKSNNVHQTKCIATSALRNASNGGDFIKQVKTETGIDIEIINGEQEATFIYEGIRAAGALSAENSLIMDIGGGCIEFIIGNNDKMLWKHSFYICASRLMERFHHTDPIPPASVEALYRYLESMLASLFDAIKFVFFFLLFG